MISTKENDSGSISRPVSVANNSNNSFKNQKMIKQFAQTLIFVVLILVASFFRDAIKQEKIRKKERAELAVQIARQNYLLEQERFMEKHRQFLSTFLQYDDHCNKIHALLYRNPNGLEKVKNSCINKKHCKSNNRKLPVRIQKGDRTPLDFALIYVFLASLMFLFARAIIDVSKEFNDPHNQTNEKTSSLHDYASSTANANSTSRRCSNTTPQKTVSQKRDPKFSRVSLSSSSDHQQAEQSNTKGATCTTISSNETCAIEKGKGIDRRSSVPVTMAHHLLKGNLSLLNVKHRNAFDYFQMQLMLNFDDNLLNHLVRKMNYVLMAKNID